MGWQCELNMPEVQKAGQGCNSKVVGQSRRPFLSLRARARRQAWPPS